MKKIMYNLVIYLIMFFCEFAFAYDIILSGVIKYETPVSYSNKTILVADDGFVEYDDVVTFVKLCVWKSMAF